MVDFTLRGLVKDTSRNNQDIVQGSDAIQNIYGDAKSKYDINAEMQRIIGDNARLIEDTKGNAELSTQQARVKAANNLGTNYKDQGEILSALSTSILEGQAASREQLDVIKEKQSVGFFENPLLYIFNQVTINDDIAKYNATVKQNNQLEAQMSTLNSLTQTTVQTQNMLTESVTAATIKASSDNISLQANMKANEEAVKGLVYNAEGIKAALGASKDLLQNKFNLFNAARAQQQADIALEHLAMSRLKFSWEAEEKVKGKQDDAFLIDQVNTGRKLRLGENADLIAPGSVRANTVLSLLKSNSPAGKEFQEDYLIAQRSSLVPGSKILAPSPAAAIELLNTMPVNLAPAQSAVRTLLDQAKNNVSAAIQTGKLDGKNKDLVTSALNAEAKRLLEEQAKKIKPGDSDNIFNIPAIQTLIANVPATQKLPVVQKVIGPAIAAGADLSDPSKVFNTVANAVRSKQISYAEALELTTLYQAGVNVNMEARQLISLGLTPRWSYKTPVKTNPTAIMGGEEVVDLTKPDSVGRALNKALASVAAQQGGGLEGGLLGFGLTKGVGKVAETAGNFGSAMRGDDIPPNTGFPMYVPTTPKK